MPLHSFTYCISCLVKQHTIYYCFCVKRITLCICLCSSSFSSHFLPALFEISANSEQKIFYHRIANAVQLFVPIKRISFESLFFSEQLQRRRILQELLDKYSDLFICVSWKVTLYSNQKPVYTVKTVMSEQIAFAAVLYFGQVFVFWRLINKSVLEWFLLIMCK